MVPTAGAITQLSTPLPVFPIAVNCWLCPAFSATDAGVICKDVGADSVTVALDVFVGSATLVALMVTADCSDTPLGGV